MLGGVGFLSLNADLERENLPEAVQVLKNLQAQLLKDGLDPATFARLQQVAIAEQFDVAVQHAAQRALCGIRGRQHQLQAQRAQVVGGGACVLRVDLVAEFVQQDQAHAARVRLELARVLAASGDVRAAGREMRAAQAAGLPSQVEQMVRFYANALSARKTLGGSIELALAPDSNVNRATRSDRLGTVIGDFLLDKDAQEKSGVGLSLRGQGYWRHGIEPGADLLVRASVGASLYRDASFNDISAALQVGPQYLSGSDRITVAAGPSWRWYGGRLYSTGYGGTANLLHPVGKRSQLQLEGGITHVRNQRNALQTADDFTLAGAFDHAFSARGGGGVQMFALREAARDPGYSFVSGGGSVYGFREMGRTTFVATMGYSHLEADARLLLYPRRRIENRLSASIGATLRALQVGPFAPLARLKWERNRSTIEIYQYRRISAEFGIGSVF